MGVKQMNLCIINFFSFIQLFEIVEHQHRFYRWTLCYEKSIVVGEDDNYSKLFNASVAENAVMIGSAKCIGVFEGGIKKPTACIVLELSCECCTNRLVTNQWKCVNCTEILEYAFDEYFYCACGRAKIDGWKFKCYHPTHGNDFFTFQQNYMKEMLSHLRRKEEINILVLGETGVGKSTWINAIANYMIYPSLEDAEGASVLSLIGTSFTMTNEKLEMQTIQIGDETNENYKLGQSSTRLPKSYVFEQDTRIVRFIDTPGIGDTRGLEQDNENFDNILKYLAYLDKLNGICILLKPNNATLTIMFRYCIQELLKYLHKDASNNIIFCFTNARSTFYRPGDTLPALKELLNEHNDTKISLDENNVYCLDNDAFRFLCASQKRIPFDDCAKKNFSVSWDKSVIETSRLFNNISKLTPHELTGTLSLNETRKLIVTLTKPLADIAQLIQTNIAVAQDKETEIKSCKNRQEELRQKLFVPAIDMLRKNLDHPRTVCTASKCVNYHPIPGTTQKTTEYVTICHSPCNTKLVFYDICPNKVLLDTCSVISSQTKCCNHCGCSWHTHMHIKYEYEHKVVVHEDESIRKALTSRETDEQIKSEFLAELRSYTKELEYEQQEITNACVIFSCFLKTNAIIPYNDAMLDYLDLLIRQEQPKTGAGGDPAVYEGLLTMKRIYEQEKEVLEKAMKIGDMSDSLEPSHIRSIIGKLYDLNLNGKKLKEIVQAVVSGNKRMMAFNETVHRPNQTNSRKGFL